MKASEFFQVVKIILGGEETSEFFQVLKIILRGGVDLGISVSPKASLEGAKSRANIRGGGLGIFSSPRAYIKKSERGRTRNFCNSQTLYRGWGWL